MASEKDIDTVASEKDIETVASEIKVVLLKSEDPDMEFDPYVDILKSSGIEATLIPVIDFRFVNDFLILDFLKCHERASGLIFTSSRAVRAVKRIHELYGFELEKWKDKMNFALGHKTAMLAESLLDFEILGAQTANSTELAQFILSRRNLIEDTGLQLIFLCSDLAGDNFLDILWSNDLNVKRIECYKCYMNHDLKENFASVVAEKGIPNIVVYFSPSGVENSHDIVKVHCGATQPKIIAIGETTATAVKEKHMRLRKVAETPTPEGILDAVKSLL